MCVVANDVAAHLTKRHLEEARFEDRSRNFRWFESTGGWIVPYILYIVLVLADVDADVERATAKSSTYTSSSIPFVSQKLVRQSSGCTYVPSDRSNLCPTPNPQTCIILQ